MPRVNVWLPAELAEVLRAELPDLNLSQLVQDAIRGVLGCRHDELACARCAEPVDRGALVDAAMSAFYSDVMWDLIPLVDRVGTAEGAARVVKEVARRHQVSRAESTPLPRPSRANRHAAKVREFPMPGDRAGGASAAAGA
jgi:hypothetical protein